MQECKPTLRPCVPKPTHFGMSPTHSFSPLCPVTILYPFNRAQKRERGRILIRLLGPGFGWTVTQPHNHCRRAPWVWVTGRPRRRLVRDLEHSFSIWQWTWGASLSDSQALATWRISLLPAAAAADHQDRDRHPGRHTALRIWSSESLQCLAWAPAWVCGTPWLADSFNTCLCTLLVTIKVWIADGLRSVQYYNFATFYHDIILQNCTKHCMDYCKTWTTYNCTILSSWRYCTTTK